jgi:hypothetical protein
MENGLPVSVDALLGAGIAQRCTAMVSVANLQGAKYFVTCLRHGFRTISLPTFETDPAYLPTRHDRGKLADADRRYSEPGIGPVPRGVGLISQGRMSQ